MRAFLQLMLQSTNPKEVLDIFICGPGPTPAVNFDEHKHTHFCAKIIRSIYKVSSRTCLKQQKKQRRGLCVWGGAGGRVRMDVRVDLLKICQRALVGCPGPCERGSGALGFPFVASGHTRSDAHSRTQSTLPFI